VGMFDQQGAFERLRGHGGCGIGIDEMNMHDEILVASH
jgi:hypothetical protein